ncbi:adenosylcobinamide-phosphate synthase CbiB [Butyrivibrio sp. FCS006]|uniref:adenosylcobinamide-phosphate synthase CbiB n=1 Tax=Butyrivibrio sp. FCS006 TaxID=1280684 RepID=UPI00047D5E68|nr:adenosylcobinamide-phosphate synthase CbiB [Butyrivibrio sp. FCS006]
MIEHFIAFFIGFLIDRIVGDPHRMPHPVRLMGRVISFLEKVFLGKETKDKARNTKKEFCLGALLWVIVVTLTFVVGFAIWFFTHLYSSYLGIAVEAILTAYCLAAKSLKDESMKVYDALEKDGLDAGRAAVSMIVGRDTDVLDEDGVVRAAVETVAENTSDGVIAPLIYCFLGGAVFGLVYKAVNTMDSMLGYHNDRYEYFGKFAAKMDDVFNYIPARISALLMIGASFFLGKEYSAKGAAKIFKRDRYNHKSPNSAQTESVLAGALSVRLAGDASYFGKVVKKPYIGDDDRPIERRDIKRACRLMYGTESLCIVLMVILAVVLSISYYR